MGGALRVPGLADRCPVCTVTDTAQYSSCSSCSSAAVQQCSTTSTTNTRSPADERGRESERGVHVPMHTQLHVRSGKFMHNYKQRIIILAFLFRVHASHLLPYERRLATFPPIISASVVRFPLVSQSLLTLSFCSCSPAFTLCSTRYVRIPSEESLFPNAPRTTSYQPRLTVFLRHAHQEYGKLVS